MPSLSPRHPLTMSRIRAILLAAIALAVTPLCVRAAPPAPPSGIAILQDLKAFKQMATVLMVAAHPDDENTALITYLARGRGYRMGYLSVTRGDGGQNLLGGEFGEELGWIRTQELLAARRLDSGRQFFTRANDFGFSKNPEETLRIWDRDKVLSDVVRVFRQFRPDVVVTRFAPDGTNTHGHHTASAILAVAAFKVSGDARVFPEQLTGDITPWQPKRIMLNGGAGGGARGAASGGVVRIESGGTDPVLNQTYAAIAGQSRAMHKSQGFGNAAGGGGGGRGGGGAAQESFQLLGGDPATTDIMDGIDTTWARVGAGGPEIAKLVEDALANFSTSDPSASVPALLAIKTKVAALPADRIIDEKRRDLDRLIANCLGLSVETTIAKAEVVPGESMALHHVATITSSVPVKWTWSNYPAISSTHDKQLLLELKPGTQAVREATETLPASTPVSQPYWLREEPDGAAGMYRVADPSLIGRPENPPAFPVQHTFEVAGQTITLSDEPVQVTPTAPPAQMRRRLDVVAAVSMAFPSEVRVFAPGIAKAVELQVTAHRINSNGTAKLEVPAGWSVAPASIPFKLAAMGDQAKLSFTITPPAKPGTVELRASAQVDGTTYTTARTEIRYDHIPVLLMQPPASIKAVAADIAIKGKSIGYLPGAGDSVAQCIEQMGYAVTQLKGSDLTADNLKKYDAVVIGVRAFNTRDDLGSAAEGNLKGLFDYAAAGGTVVEQYNRPDQLRNTTLAPMNIHLSALRVTDENAKMTFLAPDNPVLNIPNKITSSDFDNWVQERSIYLPDQWDPAFTPILGAADPGESPPNSALLVGGTGKGHWVYTSLVFFRELPAGNAGAYRLLANLISLGK
ncbi:MAG TPA: PIG-L family deacetylase [Phycisphaerae bacterium]